MALRKGVSIFECVPKRDDKEEGVMLYELLNMIIPRKKIKLCYVNTKNDFFEKLNKNKSKIIHISCHGNTDFQKTWIATPKGGKIFPKDFYDDDGLKGRNVVMTGCFLGRKDFAYEFLKGTKAKSLIAPQRITYFQDSALWCVNFYHHLLTGRFSFNGSYKYMDKMFRIAGVMKKYP